MKWETKWKHCQTGSPLSRVTGMAEEAPFQIVWVSIGPVVVFPMGNHEVWCILALHNNERCKAVLRKKWEEKKIFLLSLMYFNHFQYDIVDVQARHAIWLAWSHLPQGCQWRKTHWEWLLPWESYWWASIIAGHDLFALATETLLAHRQYLLK